MRDDRFPRDHLTARNRRYPEGGWVPVAVIATAIIWTAIAAVVLTRWL